MNVQEVDGVGAGAEDGTAAEGQHLELLARVKMLEPATASELGADASDLWSEFMACTFGPAWGEQIFLAHHAGPLRRVTEALRELQEAGMISLRFSYLPTGDEGEHHPPRAAVHGSNRACNQDGSNGENVTS